MTNAAEIRNLQLSFQTSDTLFTAVDSISFSIHSGETLALLGESGCGKSLTALGMMRLLPKQAVYGLQSEIQFSTLNACDILNLPEYQMRAIRGRRMAIIFQDPMTALNPVLSIGTQLTEAVREKKLSASELQSFLIDLLKEVEIPEPEMRLKQYPHQLSGGQKQRIVIAMALANKPEIIIADEPTTALDVTTQAQILRLLKKLQREYNLSILLITHDLSVVKAAADRVCVMYAGQLVEQAEVRAFFKNPKHPYSQQLIASIPNFEKRAFPLQAIKGSVPNLESLPQGCRFHPRCAHVFETCKTVVPELQDLDDRRVRCHLYPGLSQLPALKKGEESWGKALQESLTPVLSVKNLCVYFKAPGTTLLAEKKWIKAVDDLSLDLYPGRTLALVGESGCGKTTASRSISRLIPKTSGDMLYRGQPIEGLRGSALRDYHRRVQIIFQDPYSSMNPRMTVGDIIAEGMVAQGMKRSSIEARQLQLLDQVNLSKNSLDRYPYQFSGGQRQRICIARALAVDPEVLICDEPTSALDLSVQAQILNLLKALQLELGISYLFITHNMAVVSYLADEVMVMRRGHVIEAGSVDQILYQPQHSYTKELLASVLTIT